jgi:hypothetical protein
MEAGGTYLPNHTILHLDNAVRNSNITHRFTTLELGNGKSQRAVRAEE